MTETIPVITIDGTSGSGKGTLAHRLARELGWHYLDSGALYRITAWAALHYKVEPDDTVDFADFVRQLKIQFEADDCADGGFRVVCNGMDITQLIRTESSSRMASVVSAIPAVRGALMQQQLDFRRLPGLVTDGRDMGTVVFPDATVKLYLTASLEQRAQRRFQQLIEKGMDVLYADIERDLAARDERDMSRASAPLKPADDAIVIDTSAISINDVFKRSIQLVSDF